MEGIAACGGLRPCHEGKFFRGKIYNLGKMPVTIAEIQGIRKNLLWCKEEGHQKVEIDSDSAEAVNLLTRESTDGHPYYEILSERKKLLLEEWVVSLKHVFREAMRLADYLAKSGLRISS